jgi:hypothetical protein
MDELEMETEARKRISSSISKIETALADWERSDKPKELAGKVKFLKKTHKLLSDWMMKSLKGDKDRFSVKVRLQDFHGICRKLEKGVS